MNLSEKWRGRRNSKITTLKESHEGRLRTASCVLGNAWPSPHGLQRPREPAKTAISAIECLCISQIGVDNDSPKIYNIANKLENAWKYERLKIRKYSQTQERSEWIPKDYANGCEVDSDIFAKINPTSPDNFLILRSFGPNSAEVWFSLQIHLKKCMQNQGSLHCAVM